MISVLRWFTYPKTVTNRAQRRVTTLIKTNVLPLHQTGNLVNVSLRTVTCLLLLFFLIVFYF